VHHHVVDSNAIVFRGDDASEYADTSIGVRMSLEAEASTRAICSAGM